MPPQSTMQLHMRRSILSVPCPLHGVRLGTAQQGASPRPLCSGCGTTAEPRCYCWRGMGGSLEKRLAHDEKCSTMAWEQRGPQTYYYRSVRRNGHVMKDYVGTGPLAALSAARMPNARPSVTLRPRPGARNNQPWTPLTGR